MDKDDDSEKIEFDDIVQFKVVSNLVPRIVDGNAKENKRIS